MGEIAVRAEKLSKLYHIGAFRERYKTFRDSIVGAVTGPIRQLRNSRTSRDSSGDPTAIWALKDISFEIKHGEVVGIIGRNGAGKSTLLKILSRITEPTEGHAEIHGRVGSLLEVGTGFHSELTGRENIYLNGAILGMRRSEIEERFDEIVAFAGMEKFLDTPVKRYSTGMYMRLAFAVAAHLEPEILLVDEVLAVGDNAFQKKCLSKMSNVGRSGRTVLFVSHNMAAINTLCTRAILLEAGRVVKEGATTEVTQAYLNDGNRMPSQKVWVEDERPGNRWFRVISVALKDGNSAPATEINISEESIIEIEFEVLAVGARVQFSLVFFDANGFCAFSSHSDGSSNRYHGVALQPGHYRTSCRLYRSLLNDGRYYVSLIGASEYWADGFRIDHIISFEAIDDGVLRGNYQGTYGGVVRPQLDWSTSFVNT